jgi:L-threonylcarbamoyladenylate synthase
MTAPIEKATPDAIARAADILRGGGLVAVPTETVYGLAADATNAQAVARLYEVKGRPQFNPLIAHVNGPDMARREAMLDGLAGFAAGFYWPGPLTLVLPVAPGGTVCELARAGLETIALRHPSHSVAHDLITAFGGPLVAPSANPSGQISPVMASDVAGDLGDKIDLILDGGRCPVGIESTIVSFASDPPALLRPGGLDTVALERFLGITLARPGADPDAPRAPGQLARHYAPRALLRLDAVSAHEGEALLGFGPVPGAVANLSPSANLAEAAANLFAMLRWLDRRHDRIAVTPIPRHGLGEAINDRLRRAAAR